MKEHLEPLRVFGTDYDGVITNVEPQKAEAFGKLVKKEWGSDKDEAAGFWSLSGGTPRRHKFDHLFERQFGKKLTDEEYQKIESKYSGLLRNEVYPHLVLLPGALDLLKYTRSNFDFTFISSGIPTQELRDLISLHDISAYFDEILGIDKEHSSKRNHFREILLKQPQLVIFVGDSPEDMRIAKESKIIPVGVTTNHSEQELRDAGAMYTCDLPKSVSTIEEIGLRFRQEKEASGDIEHG